MDWHTFTATGTPAPAPPPGSAQRLGPLTVVPTAVTYPGMPASRLWEFEDARVDFGAIDADPADLGRMLLAEFALVYGNDWLMIPPRAPGRHACPDHPTRRARHLRAHHDDRPDLTARRTAPANGGCSASRAPTSRPATRCSLASALAAGLQGRAIEETLLLRDEAANLAWAIERTIEGDNGLPADRAQAAHESSPPAPAPVAEAPDTFTYHLRTDAPEHWYPLLPQRAQPTSPAMTFHLGALPRVAPGATAQLIRPRGRLLRPPAPRAAVIIHEEEIPREGTRITRGYQLARWIDGTTFLWLGRRTTTGRGEGSSGLRFDTTDP